ECRCEVVVVVRDFIRLTVWTSKRYGIYVEQSGKRCGLQSVDCVAEVFVTQAECERRRVRDVPTVLCEVRLAEQERIVPWTAEVALRATTGSGKVVDVVTERGKTATRTVGQETTFDDRRELSRSLLE